MGWYLLPECVWKGGVTKMPPVIPRRNSEDPPVLEKHVEKSVAPTSSQLQVCVDTARSSPPSSNLQAVSESGAGDCPTADSSEQTRVDSALIADSKELPTAEV